MLYIYHQIMLKQNDLNYVLFILISQHYILTVCEQFVNFYFSYLWFHRQGLNLVPD